MLLTILNITVCVCLDWRQRPWREEADEVVSRWWQKRTDPLSWPYCWLSVLLHGCKIQLIITSVNLPLGYIEATLQECAQNPSFKHMGVLLVEFSLLHSSPSCFLWKFVLGFFFILFIWPFLQSGNVECVLVEDLKNVSSYCHSVGVRKVFPDLNGTRLVFIDDKNCGFLLSPGNVSRYGHLAHTHCKSASA